MQKHFSDKQIDEINKFRDYQALFNTDTGKKILKDLEHYTNMKGTGFSLEPLEMARIAGMREVYIYIEKRVETDLNQLFDEIKQNQKIKSKGKQDV